MVANLEAYYADLPRENALVAQCRMVLEGTDLVGKRVLDVGCRRGKGVFKLSERVGSNGFVVGVDWNPAFIREARAALPQALERSGFAEGNVEFDVAFPEDLAAAGIADAAFDVVYINNGFALFAEPGQALRECSRVLKADGLVILETPFAAELPSEEMLSVARAKGDSLAAARTKEEVERWLADAGFEEEAFCVLERFDGDRGMAVIRGKKRR